MFEVLRQVGRVKWAVPIREAPSRDQCGRARRYDARLKVEIWTGTEAKNGETSEFRVKNWSVSGFLALCERRFKVGTQIGFRLFADLKRDGKWSELMRGTAKCVRSQLLSKGKLTTYGCGFETQTSLEIGESTRTRR
jgi:hypothetical protein